MRLFIAYKYTNIKDKVKIKETLLKLAETATGQGHTTFILGRDVKNWDETYVPSTKAFTHIVKNMKSADFVIAYISSKAPSKGLAMEFVMSKILGKSLYVLNADKCMPMDSVSFKLFANRVFEFNDVADFKTILTKITASTSQLLV